jgi:hypothetical protein
VTARLLLDLREQLHPVQHPVKVMGRGSRYPAAATTTASHMWKVTLYSLQENPTGEWVRVGKEHKCVTSIECCGMVLCV